MAVPYLTAFAQNGKWAAGLNIGYGSEISKPSIGVKALYNVSEKLTVAPSFNYYFKKTEDYNYGYDIEASAKLKCWDINCDLHWNVISKDNFKFYPFVGITYLHSKSEAEASTSGVSVEVDGGSEGNVGANLGIGGLLNVASNWAIGLEVKYQIIDGNQFVPSLSAMYRF